MMDQNHENYIFKYTNLIKFFNKLKSLATITNFENWNFKDKCFILRHDVDLCIDSAVKMAEIEQMLGIKSSFFFLITHCGYNLLTQSNREKVNKIKDMGFEIGLHFNPHVYKFKGDINKKLEQEIEILSSIIQQEVKSISIHLSSFFKPIPIFDGFINTYDPSFFGDKYYLSDAGMNFRGKDPFKFIENVKDNHIQILLHPIYYSLNGEKYADRVLSYFKKFSNLIDEEFAYHKQYRKELENGFLNTIVKRYKKCIF